MGILERIVRLCPECFEDYEMGAIRFDEDVVVIRVESIDDCDLLEKRRKSSFF